MSTSSRDRFSESQVLYFELHNQKIKAVIDGLYYSYAKLIELSKKRYQKNSVRRGALTIPTTYPQTDKAQADLKDLLEKRFKAFFAAEGDAVIPLTGGMTYGGGEGPDDSSGEYRRPRHSSVHRRRV